MHLQGISVGDRWRHSLALATERMALKPDCPFAQRELQRARMASEIAEIAA
jgi:hypothetical protein